MGMRWKAMGTGTNTNPASSRASTGFRLKTTADPGTMDGSISVVPWGYRYIDDTPASEQDWDFEEARDIICGLSICTCSSRVRLSNGMFYMSEPTGSPDYPELVALVSILNDYTYIEPGEKLYAYGENLEGKVLDLTQMKANGETGGVIGITFCAVSAKGFDGTTKDVELLNLAMERLLNRVLPPKEINGKTYDFKLPLIKSITYKQTTVSSGKKQYRFPGYATYGKTSTKTDTTLDNVESVEYWDCFGKNFRSKFFTEQPPNEAQENKSGLFLRGYSNSRTSKYDTGWWNGTLSPFEGEPRNKKTYEICPYMNFPGFPIEVMDWDKVNEENLGYDQYGTAFYPVCAWITPNDLYVSNDDNPNGNNWIMVNPEPENTLYKKVWTLYGCYIDPNDETKIHSVLWDGMCEAYQSTYGTFQHSFIEFRPKYIDDTVGVVQFAFKTMFAPCHPEYWKTLNIEKYWHRKVEK